MLQHHRPAPPRALRALHPNYVLAEGRRASVGESDEEQLSRKVNELADKRFGGHTTANIRELFLSYDANGDGCASKKEVRKLLEDAGIGNGLTRGMWVDGIFGKLDADKNNCITWDEYKVGAGLVEDAPPPPPPPAEPPPGPGEPSKGYTIVKGIAVTAPGTPSSWPVTTTAAPVKKPVDDGSSGYSPYLGAALAGGLGAFWLGIPYGVALAAGWLLSSKLAQ